MAGVLEGVKVIEMGQVIALPAAGAMLADWGAEVIKVEPLVGETARGLKGSGGMGTWMKLGGGEVVLQFELLNRNKKGLALDLKKASGREILHKLVQGADIFMSNYLLSSLKGLKLDYATLSKLNPGLVYTLLTGYGTAGPDKDKGGIDITAAWARSGMQYLTGEPGCPPPPQRAGMMDMATAMQTVAGTMAALVHKEKTGKGQELEFSLYHTGVWMMTRDIGAALVGRPLLPKHDRTKPPNPLWNTYCARNDRWFMLSVRRPNFTWPVFCQVIERPDLEKDSRFDTVETREQNREELIRILDEVFATKDSDEWEECFRGKRDCLYELIQTAVEVTTDPQALANDFFAEVEHPIAGKLKMITTPVKFRQDPASVRTPAPLVGQHTEEILLDLDYSRDDIARLREQGVIL